MHFIRMNILHTVMLTTIYWTRSCFPLGLLLLGVPNLLCLYMYNKLIWFFPVVRLLHRLWARSWRMVRRAQSPRMKWLQNDKILDKTKVFIIFAGGDETRSGYMRYIPVIQADISAHTTCRHALYNSLVRARTPRTDQNRPRCMHVPRSVP